MRPITPIALDGITPSDLTGLKQPDFDLVNPADLLVDDTFQRDITQKSTALIQRIIEWFRWSRFKPPICVRRNGKLYVIDGQHTAIACASHPDVTIIPVIVVDEPEIEDQAKAFVSHARDRLAVTPGQIWHAEVAAGDEEALTIQQVCERAGVTLLPYAPQGSAYKPGETIALSAIKSLIGRRGAREAGEVLSALAKSDLAPIPGEMIKAVEVLLLDDDYNEGRSEFDPDRIASLIRNLGSRAKAEARTLSAAKKIPLWRAFVTVIYKNRKSKAAHKGASLFPAPIAEPILRQPDAKPAKHVHVSAQPAAKPKGGQTVPPPPAPISSAARALAEAHRARVRMPEPATYMPGDPLPGRSALDQRRGVA